MMLNSIFTTFEITEKPKNKESNSPGEIHHCYIVLKRIIKNTGLIMVKMENLKENAAIFLEALDTRFLNVITILR